MMNLFSRRIPIRLTGIAAIVAGLFFSVCGCAGLVFKQADVAFENPMVKLGIQKAEPSAEELAGVTLRELPDFKTPRKYREEDVFYAQIQNGKGAQLTLNMNRTVSFKPGSRMDSFIQLSQTVIEGEGGEFLEENELTTRGEIIKFFRGHHHSKIDHFQITNWKRTPVYPDAKIKMGDAWSYEEEMGAKVKIDSFWVKVLDSEPEHRKAQSRLEGFVLVGNRRCAVIKTKIEQTKNDHFKVLFKNISMKTQARIQETTYLDYASGAVIATVTRIDSFTQGLDNPITDSSEIQSIVYQV